MILGEVVCGLDIVAKVVMLSDVMVVEVVVDSSFSVFCDAVAAGSLDGFDVAVTDSLGDVTVAKMDYIYGVHAITHYTCTAWCGLLQCLLEYWTPVWVSLCTGTLWSCP